MGRLRVAPRNLPQNLAPTGWRCVTFQIPDDDEWERIAWSTLYDQLALTWTNWKRTGDATGSKLCVIWRASLRTWKHCDNSPTPSLGIGSDAGDDILIRQNPDNPCLLESSVDGTNWCVFADISKCQNFGTQPGAADSPPAPTPGGGTQEYCYPFNANNRLLIPVVVNTGDTIELMSQNGAGWDGGEGSPLSLWRCPDGEQFIAGQCVG